MVKKRDEYESVLESLIERMAADRQADVIDKRLQTYALVAMGTHVSTWYRADGPMPLHETVRNYTVMVLRQLGMATDEIDRVRAETPA